ncbi:serum response factor protein A [Trifolium repens]|nr:serum response factor protein A [Trifolium repens]
MISENTTTRSIPRVTCTSSIKIAFCPVVQRGFPNDFFNDWSLWMMDGNFKSLQNTRQRCVCYNHRNDCFPVEEIVNDLHHTFVLNSYLGQSSTNKFHNFWTRIEVCGNFRSDRLNIWDRAAFKWIYRSWRSVAVFLQKNLSPVYVFERHRRMVLSRRNGGTAILSQVGFFK